MSEGRLRAEVARDGQRVAIDAEWIGRRSGPITMIVASVGRGDARRISRGVIMCGPGVVAFVAIGGGGVVLAHWACSPSGGAGLPHDVGDRNRRCTIAIAMVIVIATSGTARSRCARRCYGRRRRHAARPRTRLRGQNRGPSRCCEASVRRRCGAPRQTRRRSCGGDVQCFERARGLREARRRDVRDSTAKYVCGAGPSPRRGTGAGR